MGKAEREWVSSYPMSQLWLISSSHFSGRQRSNLSRFPLHSRISDWLGTKERGEKRQRERESNCSFGRERKERERGEEDASKERRERRKRAKREQRFQKYPRLHAGMFVHYLIWVAGADWIFDLASAIQETIFAIQIFTWQFVPLVITRKNSWEVQLLELSLHFSRLQC